jgi:hypothetical protein
MPSAESGQGVHAGATVSPPAQIGVPGDGADRPEASSPPGDASLDADIRLSVGGRFSVDHLGPEAFDALIARLEAQPDDYLRRFEELYFVRADPSMAPIPPGVRSEILLGYLYPRAIERVRFVAARHRRIDQEALRDGSYEPREREAIAWRIEQLGLLADGIDLPFADSWFPVTPNEWCVHSAPPRSDTVLRVTSTCTCGEPLACAATLEGDRLVVQVRTDPTSPGRCTDCYATHTACRLPPLPPSATFHVIASDTTPRGAGIGTLQTYANGVLVNPPRCPPR